MAEADTLGEAVVGTGTPPDTSKEAFSLLISDEAAAMAAAFGSGLYDKRSLYADEMPSPDLGGQAGPAGGGADAGGDVGGDAGGDRVEEDSGSDLDSVQSEGKGADIQGQGVLRVMRRHEVRETARVMRRRERRQNKPPPLPFDPVEKRRELGIIGWHRGLTCCSEARLPHHTVDGEVTCLATGKLLTDAELKAAGLKNKNAMAVSLA